MILTYNKPRRATANAVALFGIMLYYLIVARNSRKKKSFFVSNINSVGIPYIIPLQGTKVRKKEFVM